MRIDVRNVSVRYLIGDLRDIGLKDYFIQKIQGRRDVRELWALRDITFSLRPGDMCGIIGNNGAGKSTLLKVISGIMRPTTGRLVVDGEIAALLELGSGFDSDLTVRENTYLRGAMLGYTREFMNAVYKDIINFSELEEYQDMPFKKLSSGMKSRLAFSIASLVNPDILILDEVLSVGDVGFRKKSEAKMMEIIHGGAITLYVAHQLPQIRKLCNRVLWIEKGEQKAFGETDVVCDAYEMYINGCTK